REVVEFDIPGRGRGRTEYGIEPGRKDRFYVKFRRDDGRTETLRFADEKEYGEYRGRRTVGATRDNQVELVRDLQRHLAAQRRAADTGQGPGTRSMVGTVPPASGRSLGDVIDDILTKGPSLERAPPLRIAEAHAALRAGTATTDDIEVLLREAIIETRAYIRAEQRGAALSWDELFGYCPTGRDCTATAFAAMAGDARQTIRVHRFQAEDLFGKKAAQHGFNVIVLENGDRILVDPTFGQFMRPRGAPPAAGPAGMMPPEFFSAEVLRGLPKGPELASKLLRDGFVRLDDEFAALYARALGASEAKATEFVGQLKGGQARMPGAEGVDTFGPLGTGADVATTQHSPSLIIETATKHVAALRPQGDPKGLVPTLLRLILRLGGDVPPR
ncbi:MAG TPA: hypothetical protein VLE23_17325, partial [Geminicoccaceae bacterium]|nr:hypothetical protein [Geminicoccaceae bacterium]